MSDADVTALRAPLLGTAPELRGILDEGWLGRLPLAMPLANPGSARAGEGRWTGKPAISSSLPEFPRVAGDEGMAEAAFSSTPLTEIELGRIEEAETLENIGAETPTETGVA